MSALTADFSPQRATKRNRIEGSLQLGGGEFPFYLVRQNLQLGSAGEVQFYYMPPADLRSNDPLRKVSNVKSCIGHWYTAMREIGEADDPHQLRHFVMAICYSLVNRDKGPQSIYRDAFLYPECYQANEESLPDDIRLRIRRVVKQRDRTAIKTEFDNALGAAEFSPGDHLGYQKSFGIWADKGVNAYRHHGEEGVIKWLGEVDSWLHKYRKRCPPRVRGFINFFSFQAKVSFYLCFANFWRSLIPWLEAKHGLDELSKKFLYLWHNQNQPIEIPHGRTLGGINYPTRRGVQLHLPDRWGGFAPRQLSWQTEHLGPTHLPDVFSGHVLSLHPLGWYLLSDSYLRQVVGDLVASPNFETTTEFGADDFLEYWNFVYAVLTAAYQYRQAHDNYENLRGVHVMGGDATLSTCRDDSPPPSADAFMLRYVSSLELSCDCGAVYLFVELESSLSESDSDAANHDSDRKVLVRCNACGKEKFIIVTEPEIDAFLFTDAD